MKRGKGIREGTGPKEKEGGIMREKRAHSKTLILDNGTPMIQVLFNGNVVRLRWN